MIDVTRCTKHERNVLIGALAQYRNRQGKLEQAAAGDRTKAQAKANGYVASDLMRQVNER